MEDCVLLARKTSVDIYLLHKFRIVNIYEEVIAWQNKLQSTVCALWQYQRMKSVRECQQYLRI